jgi:hypothetical protein
MLGKLAWGCGLDSTVSGQGPVAGYCECVVSHLHPVFPPVQCSVRICTKRVAGGFPLLICYPTIDTNKAGTVQSRIQAVCVTIQLR